LRIHDFLTEKPVSDKKNACFNLTDLFFSSFSFLASSNILPSTLSNQLMKNGPTTFCCNPNCLKPIFEYCCLGISEVRMMLPDVQPQDVIKVNKKFESLKTYCDKI